MKIKLVERIVPPCTDYETTYRLKLFTDDTKVITLFVSYDYDEDNIDVIVQAGEYIDETIDDRTFTFTIRR